MNLIVAIIVSLLVGGAFYGVWRLLGGIMQGVPQAIAGIVLILIWLVITLHVTGIYKFGADTHRSSAVPHLATA